MLNKYLAQLNDLINQYKDHELSQFEGPNNKSPDFDDLAWYFIDPNTGRRTRFLSCKHYDHETVRKLAIRVDSSLKKDMALPNCYGELLKIYIIHLCNN